MIKTKIMLDDITGNIPDIHLFHNSSWLSIKLLQRLWYSGIALTMAWVASLIFSMLFLPMRYFWLNAITLFTVIWVVHLIYIWHCNLINRQRAGLARLLGIMQYKNKIYKITVQEQIDPIIQEFEEDDRHYVFGEFYLYYLNLRDNEEPGDYPKGVPETV